MDEEVTATQAAALIGVSERTIRRKIAAGQLPARRVATNRFAIAVSDLPRRRGIDALTARIEAVEQRVERLEGRLYPLAASVGHEHLAQMRPDTGQPAEETYAASLRDLIAQLTREVERLSPLLTADSAGDGHTDGARRSPDQHQAQHRSNTQRKRRA